MSPSPLFSALTPETNFEGFPDLLWDPDDKGDVDMDQDADAMVKLLVSNNVAENVARPYVLALFKPKAHLHLLLWRCMGEVQFVLRPRESLT